MSPSITALCRPVFLSLWFLSGTALIADEGGVDPRNHGAAGDGAGDDTVYLEKAVAKAEEKDLPLVLRNGTFRVTRLHVPDAVQLRFGRKGALLVDRGGVLRIDGAIEAGQSPILLGEGEITGSPDTDRVNPYWFGAAGDGLTDDTRALQRAAVIAAGSTGRVLWIPEGAFVFTEDIEIRSNVKAEGILIKKMEIDPERTEFSHQLYLPTHYLVNDALVRFVPDREPVELNFEAFAGIREGDFSLPVHREVPLADGSGSINLEERATLRFFSTDFFTSRRIRAGDRWYDKNDIVQVVSSKGDVFPEFAFDYDHPEAAPEWEAGRVYRKGDYVRRGGELFKATFPSGPSTRYVHAHLGEVAVGPLEPDPEEEVTLHRFQYPDGTASDLRIWRRVYTRVWYHGVDRPVTVDGLRVELRLKTPSPETYRIRGSAVRVKRSNMTFENLSVTVRDANALMRALVESSEVVNVEFRNGYVSGATSPHLGYNFLNMNVANFRYYDCISTNSRKGMDGRHAKNVRIEGGLYNIIEDHYGRNFTIRDVTMTGLSVYVPGDSTPEADLAAWEFRPRRPFGYSGANLLIENATINRAAGGILGARADTGDFYGGIVLRDIVVRGNDGDVNVFSHAKAGDFDYASEVKSPDLLRMENIRLEEPGKLHFDAIGREFSGGSYGPVVIRSCGPIGYVFSTSQRLEILDSFLDEAELDLAEGAAVILRGNRIRGELQGLEPDHVLWEVNNLRE